MDASKPEPKFKEKSMLKCQCKICVNMPTVTEFKCCKTTNSIDGKDEAGLTRITDHIAFRVNCLNIHVLGVTYYDHSLQTGPLEENQRIHEIPNRESDEFKQESSSTYSSMSSSNFTMSCSGVDEQDEKEPSTSGCSSFLAHAQLHQKAKKKERVKEYLKELKSIVQPVKGGHGRMGTLSTLQHVLTSMRKMKEGKQKSKIDKKLLPAPEKEDMTSVLQCDLMHTVYESDSHESLTSESLKSSDELRIVLSTSDHIVQSVSGNLRFVLGYPKDSWIGRSFDDYIHKKDLITFNSFHRNEWDSESCSQFDDDEVKTESKIVYFRLRKFKGLGSSGFSLRKQESYIPFQCMFTLKKMTIRELNKEGSSSSSWYEESTSGNSGSMDIVSESPSPPDVKQNPDKKRLYTILYCVPLVSPYSGDATILPEVKSFETRHTLFCSYCHIQPNTIPLLGYLPQEMIGVSIFDFYHNDDLKILYNIYQKVISLKGVPYRSHPVRLRAKNGSWITCMTEWSSFVNPWTKRLEFIIGKHNVVKGPENRDVFSDNFHIPTLEETPEPVLQARQKIKDLLLQPVETVYVGSSPEKGQGKGKGKSVAISDQAQEIPKLKETDSETTKHELMYQHDLDKSKLHTTGLIFKTASISRAYDQLNYTNCIKKFLLSQPRTYTSDSDAKKSSSDDTVDLEEEDQAKEVDKWMNNFENIVPPSSIHLTSVDSRSLPALNDDYWKKTLIPSDTDFDFDISVPKPPSFGSSTKVLVSEQEHRDNDNSLDQMGLREILQVPPTSSHNVEITSPSSPKSTTSATSAENPKLLTLTRDTLMKHTLLQEQLYLATASPDRNVVFISESQNTEKSPPKKQRQSLKRSHSPDQSSMERCKSGRHSEERPSISTASILNPSFPLSPSFDGSQLSGDKSPKSAGRVPVSVHIFPIVTLCPNTSASTSVVNSTGQSKMNTHTIEGIQPVPYYFTDLSQMMVGFQQTPMHHTGLTGNSMPIPVQQLNSYIMQQASMEHNLYGKSPGRKKMERDIGKIQQPQSSTEESSTEDTLSSLYLLESENKVKMAYHELVMQSLAQNMAPQGRGLNPAPWLESVCFTDNLQLKYHMPKTKHKRQLKKDREEMEKLVQPDLLMEQFDQLLSDMENTDGAIMDEELDYIIFPLEGDSDTCSCVELPSCRQCCVGDHGISEALKQFRKSNKKEKRSRKCVPESTSSSASSMLNDLSNVNIKVDDGSKSVEVEDENEAEKMDIDSDCNESLVPEAQEVTVKSTPRSCSSKSDLGDGDIRCDASSDSLNSNACSELTPSDQRSHNENGSSLKESDGDAMSKKSDSSSDKQQGSSESESESKSSYQKELYSKLFTSLDVCFPHLHKNSVPWLVDANFTEDVKMQYQLVIGDREATLKSDREKLESFKEPSLINDQLSALIEDLREGESFDPTPTSEQNETLKDPSRGGCESNVSMRDRELECMDTRVDTMEEGFDEETFLNLFSM